MQNQPDPQSKYFLCKLYFEGDDPEATPPALAILPRLVIESLVKLLPLEPGDSPEKIMTHLDSGHGIGIKRTEHTDFPLPHDAQAILIEATYICYN